MHFRRIVVILTDEIKESKKKHRFLIKRTAMADGHRVTAAATAGCGEEVTGAGEAAKASQVAAMASGQASGQVTGQVTWRLVDTTSDGAGASYSLPHSMIFLGREKCDIVVSNKSVDKRHAVISYDHYQDSYKVDMRTLKGVEGWMDQIRLFIHR